MTKMALIVSEFNSEITARMKIAAEERAKELGAEIVVVYSVPGALDSPFALKKALKRKDVDCAAVLGAVIKGETDHDAVVANTAADKIVQLSLEFEKPVGFGVMGPNCTWEKAEERAEGYGKRAVEAAVKLCRL
ncbi:6,7-dimethyl-8-ribityllumazine synthase [Candidatus Gugararchaeum adminiculabundum]|nr:6,7-dimethyl-8-ribityllumazine synthase [Candidatus Gugararchaeum adminiculabundum]